MRSVEHITASAPAEKMKPNECSGTLYSFGIRNGAADTKTRRVEPPQAIVSAYTMNRLSRSRCSTVKPWSRALGARRLAGESVSGRRSTATIKIAKIDTGVIVPGRFMRVRRRPPEVDYSDVFLHDLRFDDNDRPRADFVLNQPAYQGAGILVTGIDFGCGSSREHAPWALDNFGIRCVIAPDFADIFYNNAFKNGMLLIKLPQEQIDMLTKDAENGANATFTVDLEKQEITRPDGEKIKFNIDPFKKHCLLNGLDDIGLTLQKDKKIASYEEKMKATQPWL